MAASNKVDVRRLSDKGGGADPKVIDRMKREGKLKQYASLEEARQARIARKERGVEETPAHLLPEDHYRKRKRYTITLGKEAHAIAKKVAKGNVSRGIEYALMHWFDCPRTDRRRVKGTR